MTTENMTSFDRLEALATAVLAERDALKRVVTEQEEEISLLKAQVDRIWKERNELLKAASRVQG